MSLHLVDHICDRLLKPLPKLPKRLNIRSQTLDLLITNLNFNGLLRILSLSTLFNFLRDDGWHTLLEFLFASCASCLQGLDTCLEIGEILGILLAFRDIGILNVLKKQTVEQLTSLLPHHLSVRFKLGNLDDQRLRNVRWQGLQLVQILRLCAALLDHVPNHMLPRTVQSCN